MDYVNEWYKVKQFCTEYVEFRPKILRVERHEADLFYTSSTKWLPPAQYWALPKIEVTHYGHLLLHLLEVQILKQQSGSFINHRVTAQKLSEYLQCAKIHLNCEHDAYRHTDTNYFGYKIRQFSPHEHFYFSYILDHCLETIPMPKGVIMNYMCLEEHLKNKKRGLHGVHN